MLLLRKRLGRAAGASRLLPASYCSSQRLTTHTHSTANSSSATLRRWGVARRMIVASILSILFQAAPAFGQTCNLPAGIPSLGCVPLVGNWTGSATVTDDQSPENVPVTAVISFNQATNTITASVVFTEPGDVADVNTASFQITSPNFNLSGQTPGEGITATGTLVMTQGAVTFSGSGGEQVTSNPDTGNGSMTISNSGLTISASGTETEGGSASNWSATLTFTSNGQQLSGMVTKSDNFSIAFTATQQLMFTSTTLPAGAVTVPYGADIQVTGGTPPYTFALLDGSALPAGFTLAPTGSGNVAAGHVHSDNPSTAGTYTFDVSVTDSTAPTPQTSNATVSLTIAPMPANTQPGLLKGQYAMLMRGYNEVTGAEEAIIGSLTFDGAGNITTGELDINSTTVGIQTGGATGVYVIGSDNRGVMSITPAGQTRGSSRSRWAT